LKKQSLEQSGRNTPHDESRTDDDDIDMVNKMVKIDDDSTESEEGCEVRSKPSAINVAHHGVANNYATSALPSKQLLMQRPRSTSEEDISDNSCDINNATACEQFIKSAHIGSRNEEVSQSGRSSNIVNDIKFYPDLHQHNRSTEPSSPAALIHRYS
jgi:hypothetical protein